MDLEDVEGVTGGVTKASRDLLTGRCARGWVGTQLAHRILGASGVTGGVTMALCAYGHGHGRIGPGWHTVGMGCGGSLHHMGLCSWTTLAGSGGVTGGVTIV